MTKMYAGCYNYEGGHAIFTTLEKAIEYAKDCGMDYIEEWPVDPEEYVVTYLTPVVWEKDSA